MKKIEIPPILNPSLREKSVSLPSYVFVKETKEIGIISFILYKLFLMIVAFIVKIRLRMMGSSYRNYQEAPDQDEVERIYTREAMTYETKHHKTTHFRDTWWRREIAFDLLSFLDKGVDTIDVLDIGTGIGLSVEEILRICKLLKRNVKAIGVDYNTSMLEQANNIIRKRMDRAGITQQGKREAEFLRADARNLTSIAKPQTFDCITTICGIGGIDTSRKVFQEILAVLKVGGVFVMLDIHRPLFHIPEQWPFPLAQKHGALFSFLGWEKITKPLILGSLWGWRDPTANFYTSQLAVWFDRKSNKYYGFKKLHFRITNESWWLRLPVMTTAKIILKKIQISKEIYDSRLKVYNQLSA